MDTQRTAPRYSIKSAGHTRKKRANASILIGAAQNAPWAPDTLGPMPYYGQITGTDNGIEGSWLIELDLEVGDAEAAP